MARNLKFRQFILEKVHSNLRKDEIQIECRLYAMIFMLLGPEVRKTTTTHGIESLVQLPPTEMENVGKYNIQYFTIDESDNGLPVTTCNVGYKNWPRD